MSFNPNYSQDEPARAEIDASIGPVLLEFGNPWCGHCRLAAPLIAEAFDGHLAVRHLKVADASGRPLGRSFGVKLWPTLVFIRDGKEIAKIVRPRDAGALRRAMREIDG